MVSGIINLEQFPVDEFVAAVALDYIREQRAEACAVEWRGDQEWYIGWGGRAVVLEQGKAPKLKAFRRFEYRLLDKRRKELEADPLGALVYNEAVKLSFKLFRDAAELNRKKGDARGV